MSNEVFKEWQDFAKRGKDVSLLSKLNELTEIEKDTLFNKKKKLKFGTAGVRAKVGIGPSLLNEYNVFRLGLAFADTFSDENKQKGVIVLHDTRIYNDIFSDSILKAFVHRGFKKIYIYKKNDACITPMISFFIRKLQIGGGIMITASHNPPEYQGIKFYDWKGIQISDSVAKNIEERLNHIKLISFAHIKKTNLVTIPNKYVAQYFDMLKQLYLTNRFKQKNKAKILVTNLQGASAPFVERLKALANLDITLVPTEKKPDGRFSYAQSTNPEDFNKAYNNSLPFVDEDDYDALVAIDPDGDRLGVIDLVALKKAINSTSKQALTNLHDFLNPRKPWCLSGNKIGALLLDHVLEMKKEHNKDKQTKGFVVRSYVTSDFVDLIGEKYGLETYETFTGFKWIGGKVESIKNAQVIMGFEESIGYFFSDEAREKDSLQALVVLITLIERLKKDSVSLVGHLGKLFRKYNKVFVDETSNIYAKINYDDFLNIIDLIQNSEMVKNGELTIKKIYNPSDDTKISLIKLHLAKKAGWIALRPSGTEPKIKTYYVLNGETESEIRKKIEKYKEIISYLIEEYIRKKND